MSTAPNDTPPAVAPHLGPTGERADWWWYTPYEPKPPPANKAAGAQTGWE